MKKMAYLAAVLMLGVCAAPANAAGSELDKAVALSAPDSGASLSAICNSVYRAVKESPGEMDKVFATVINQRTTWKASECYAIMRAALLARPDLACLLCSSDLSRSRVIQDSKGGKGGANGSLHLDPLLNNMISSLYQASLEDGVAEETINLVTCTLCNPFTGLPDIGVNTNGAEWHEDIIPTPPPVSPSI